MNYFFWGLSVMVLIDFESPFNTFRVLSSTTMPRPEDESGFSSVVLSSVFLLPLASFDAFLDLALQDFATIHLMKCSCDRTRCCSSRVSTGVAAAFFFFAIYSSTSFRRLVFSSRKASRDCSSSDVRDFLRRRLFLACLRLRSLFW